MNEPSRQNLGSVREEFDLDFTRFERTGLAEAVYAPGKSPSQCAVAVAGLRSGAVAAPVFLTRANVAQISAATSANPGGVRTAVGEDSQGNELAMLTWLSLPHGSSRALVVTAGTGDLPVAGEAVAVLEAYGVTTSIVPDVGVAGLHRVLAHSDEIETADIVLVVAGMEGALASVVTGMTRAPVIAVPTSTGYGSGFEGVTALLGMMASCSPGVVVVGIDNGFGAACAATRILQISRRADSQ